MDDMVWRMKGSEAFFISFITNFFFFFEGEFKLIDRHLANRRLGNIHRGKFAHWAPRGHLLLVFYFVSSGVYIRKGKGERKLWRSCGWVIWGFYYDENEREFELLGSLKRFG